MLLVEIVSVMECGRLDQHTSAGPSFCDAQANHQIHHNERKNIIMAMLWTSVCIENHITDSAMLKS